MVRFLIGIFVFALALSAPGILYASDDYKLLRIAGQYVKWGAPEYATGATVTYAILYGDRVHAGERNCVSTAGVEPLLMHSTLSSEVMEREVAAAFAMWSEVTDVRFEPASDIDAADILVGAQIVPRGRGYADISVSDNSGGAFGEIERGLICLNPDRLWVPGALDDLSEREDMLRYALAHEIGHLLGLDHPGAHGSLMSFSYDEEFSTLQPGDVAGAVTLYGPAPGGGRFADGSRQRLLPENARAEAVLRERVQARRNTMEGAPPNQTVELQPLLVSSGDQAVAD